MYQTSKKVSFSLVDGILVGTTLPGPGRYYGGKTLGFGRFFAGKIHWASTSKLTEINL